MTLGGADNGMVDRILHAARDCFARYGVQRTTMADVAGAAGISRQTLYNTVPGRDELIEAVVVMRIAEIAELLQEVVDQPSVVDAIVDTSVAAVELARHDPELTNLVDTASSHRLFEVIAGSHPAVGELVARLFRPLFDQARQAGELRGDVSDDELIDWIRTIYLSLILRRDLDRDGVHEAVRTFLVPSLTARAGRLYAVRRL